MFLTFRCETYFYSLANAQLYVENKFIQNCFNKEMFLNSVLDLKYVLQNYNRIISIRQLLSLTTTIFEGFISDVFNLDFGFIKC